MERYRRRHQQLVTLLVAAARAACGWNCKAVRRVARALRFASDASMRGGTRFDSGQSTVEYAIVAAGVACVLVAGGVLWHLFSDGGLVEHALMSASHHLSWSNAGNAADVFAY